MEKILMKKGNMVHYVPCESEKDFLSFGWEKAYLTEKKEENTTKETTTKETTKKKTKKSN